MPILVIDGRANVRLIEAGKPLKAEPGERVLWFGYKQRKTRDSAEKTAAANAAETPRPLV